MNNICHQLRSTLPQGFFFAKKKCRVSFSWAIYVFFVIFSWLGLLKIQNSKFTVVGSSQRIPVFHPTPESVEDPTDLLPPMFFPPSAAQLQVFPPGFHPEEWFWLGRFGYTKTILYHLMLPSKTKRNLRFLCKTCKKNTSSQKLAEQLSGHGLDKDKVPGSINTFYWG